MILAPRPFLRKRGGFAMFIALVLIALLMIVGATSLQVAGVDQRVATHNRRHMMVLNTADAGTVHARYQLQNELPANEGWDTADTGTHWIYRSEGETDFEGIAFPMNQGVYEVDAVFQKCSNPPPGYSTEQGRTAFHSQFWNMKSTASFQDTTYTEVNPTRATVVATLRKVVRGDCKIR